MELTGNKRFKDGERSDNGFRDWIEIINGEETKRALEFELAGSAGKRVISINRREIEN